jgi:hypothetical protein
MGLVKLLLRRQFNVKVFDVAEHTSPAQRETRKSLLAQSWTCRINSRLSPSRTAHRKDLRVVLCP